MFNSQKPKIEDLPTSRQLLRATAIAIIAAGAILVTVVLPSEYAIDPTGIGRQLGLTQMGEIKAQLAEEAAANAAAGAAPAAPVSQTAPAKVAAAGAAAAARSDTMKVTLAPGQGAEIKATMAKGARVNFDWSVEGGRVNFDTHADAPGVDYHGYGKGKDTAGESGPTSAPV